MARRKNPYSKFREAKVKVRLKEVRFKNGKVWKVHTRDDNNRISQMYEHIVAVDESFKDQDIFWAVVAFANPMSGYIGYSTEPNCNVPVQEIPTILYYKLNEAFYEPPEA